MSTNRKIALFSGDYDDLSNTPSDVTDLSLYSTSDLSEGTNLYYTDARAISAINNDADHGSTAQHDYFSGDYNDLTNLPSIAYSSTIGIGGLDDVSLSSPSSGEVLQYNGSNWVNSTVSSSPAGSDGYVQFNDSGSFGADDGLFWDNTNKRLGIGTTSPSYPLEVNGEARLSATSDMGSNDASLATKKYVDDNAVTQESTGTLNQANATQNQVFDALGSSIPDNSDKILISGGGKVTSDGDIVNFSHAKRIDATTIQIAGFNETDVFGFTLNCNDRNSTTVFDLIMISW